MKTIALTDIANDWRAIVRDVQANAAPAALVIDGIACGILLPSDEAARIVTHYAVREQRQEHAGSARPFDELPTYLDLLRADQSAVPSVDGQPLEFLTMMNSSYTDPQQIYQFRHPRTHQIYVYRTSELQRAIGRPFARVEFIPANPKAYVEGKP